MMNKLFKLLIWIFLIVPAIYLALIFERLPASVPLHYNIKGEPDRYGSKHELIIVIIILSAVSLLVYFILTNLHRIDPKKNAGSNKSTLHRLAFAAVVFISALSILIIYMSSQPGVKIGTGLILSAVGLFFAVIGNYMPSLKPNYFAGIRIPWTLENPDNWRKTHTLAGKLWFAGGLLIAITCLFLPSDTAFVFFIIVTLMITLIPCIYSYRYFKNQSSI